MLGLWRRLVYVLRRRQFEEDLEEEMLFHAEMTGKRQFGNVTLLKEDSRIEWGFSWFDRLIQDLRFAIRMLRKSPAFATVAVLSLALGIGANTAIFSVIYAIVLRSLPVQHPEQLVALSSSNLMRSGMTSFGYPFYRELRDRDVFSGVLCQTGMSASLSVNGSAERIIGELVSANYFYVLGLRPSAGRLFRSDDETAPGANRVVVLSYGFWRRRFAGDLAVIGTTVDLNTIPMTVIGVGPPEFDSLNAGYDPDVRVPITMQPQMYLSESMLASKGDWWLDLIGRMKPGVSKERAEAELTGLLRSYLDQSNSGKPISEFRRRVLKSWRVDLLLAGTGLATKAKKAAKQLYVLMGVVALVLLNGCLNIANLLLARTAARQREIAIRLSLGAARPRLIRQLLTESILLGMMGGVFGLVLAIWGGRLLINFLLAGQTGVSIDVTPNLQVLAFTLGLSVLTGILFGIAPALRSTRFELTPELKGEQSRAPGIRIAWPKLLVSLQVALSLLLLIGAGLFLRSLDKLRNMDLGFDKRNVLAISMDPGLSGYTQARAQAFYRELRERTSQLPGVVSVSFSRVGLVSGSGWGSGVTVQGYQPKEDDRGPDRNIVGPEYFTTLRIPIVAGRDFNLTDHAHSPHVAIVNESFARFYFGKQNPIGKLIGAGGNADPRDFSIVGIARDGKYQSLREETPRFWYVPYEQYNETRDFHGLTMYVRTTGDPLAEAGAVRQVVRAIDPNVPLFNIKTLEQQIDANLATDRMVATLSTFFSLLAALVAGIGLYGVMSYSMTRRTREIGIRMALGAQPRNVIGSVMGEVAVLVAVGTALGIVCAVGLGRLISSLLYEIKPVGSATFCGAVSLAIVVTLVAGYLPARRAALINPTVALRSE